MGEKKLHIAMYPWLAMSHLNSFLQLANKLAERGHKISFLLPPKTQAKFEPFNLHKHLISFVPVAVPCVDGLPPGTETTADVPFPLHSLVMAAMDLTEPAIEAILSDLKPHFVLYDFTHWLPPVAHKLGIKAVQYCFISSATIGYLVSPERKLREKMLTEADLLKPPPSFPPSMIKLSPHDARGLVAATVKEFGGIPFTERQLLAFTLSDAIGFKTCREIEGPYCDYLGSQFGKPVILAGPVLPEPPRSVLEEKWEKLLGGFSAKSLIYCAFGSECTMNKDQFQELVLGFELTGLPFVAALKPPRGCDTIESALPEGFEERVKGRGFVHGGWVQQQLILNHPSVGCFVTHCGSSSLSEAMMTECQLVLLPNVGDQIINARLMAGDLKVGVEVERGEEDGLFTREGVCRAVMSVMDENSDVGKQVRENHATQREFILSQGLESSYIDGFVQNLHGLLGPN
ncbi:hypothetical protein JRO89_XS06G0061200 [Xanthoceras sorbifolium]|uniref:Glycosyltransferase n=1 Tax=Xanthoceras sorbifolium TaxID=99658 RepID=A0ABQ8HWV5_9ROSI|nr:hypothetical protein JRO89_XS06G0061200 [Xanthoceras sorbifolium]